MIAKPGSGACYLLVLTGLTAVLGCGEPDAVRRVDIQGTATFDGLPIIFGDVEFLPDQQKGHQAPSGYAEIVVGEFDTSLSGQGIVPGPHIVRVTAYSKRPDEVGDETIETEAITPLFVGYEMDMDISPGILDIEVPAEAAGFNFMDAGSKRERAGTP